MVTKVSFEFDSEKEAKDFGKTMDRLGWDNQQLKNGVYVELVQETPEHLAREVEHLAEDIMRSAMPRYRNRG